MIQKQGFLVKLKVSLRGGTTKQSVALPQTIILKLKSRTQNK